MKFIYSNYTLYRPWQLLFSFLDLLHLLRNQVPFSDTVLKKSVQCKNHPKYTDFHGRHLLLGFWHIFSSNPLAFGQHWNHLQPGSTTSTPPIWSCPWSESFSEFSLTFFSNSNFVNRTPMTSFNVSGGIFLRTWRGWPLQPWLAWPDWAGWHFHDPGEIYTIPKKLYNATIKGRRIFDEEFSECRNKHREHGRTCRASKQKSGSARWAKSLL